MCVCVCVCACVCVCMYHCVFVCVHIHISSQCDNTSSQLIVCGVCVHVCVHTVTNEQEIISIMLNRLQFYSNAT